MAHTHTPAGYVPLRPHTVPLARGFYEITWENMLQTGNPHMIT